jgi:hypothetical protein
VTQLDRIQIFELSLISATDAPLSRTGWRATPASANFKSDTTSLTGITKTNVQRKSQLRPFSKPPASRMNIQTTKLAELPSQIARAQRSLIAISLKLGKCNTGLHNQYASIVMYYILWCQMKEIVSRYNKKYVPTISLLKKSTKSVRSSTIHVHEIVAHKIH